MLFTMAICHYIDRDCSFDSYVNKKAHNQQPLCRLSSFTVLQCAVTYDRSIALLENDMKKILFFCCPERMIKSVRIDAFSVLYES